MPNFIKLEMIIEIGFVKRGKYTFPKILALAINTFDVFVKHSAK